MDLGLPSETLWATMNVGASKPSEAGLYFQWGDTKGYTKEQIGTGDGQKKFDSRWSDYKWYESGRAEDGNIKFKKYNIEGATLELEDDAAYIHMGGSWHIPSPDQINELIDNTTTAWTSSDDVSGMTFTSKNDTSKFIFIPAAGYVSNGLVGDSGSNGRVWSSMLELDASWVTFGQELYFNSSLAILSSYDRHYGYSVRGVLG